jgi:DNA-binding CsgD family transcriptional regulator/tetratricopeptide (TPR) repeat protein
MGSRVVSTALVGRSAEMAELAAAFRQALDDGPALALVAGEAGIGKSRLVREFVAGLDPQVRQVVGNCLEFGAESLPFAPFLTIVRRLVREQGADNLATLLPGHGRSLAAWLPDFGDQDTKVTSRHRLFEEVLTLLELAAAQRPTVVVLEDLHWSDASSRELLLFLDRNLTQRGLLVIGTYRTDALDFDHPVRSLAAGLERGSRTRVVRPHHLDRAEVGRQLAAILGDEPEQSVVASVHEWSGGNPLFVEAINGAGLRAPAVLRNVVLSGFTDLPERSRAALRAASALASAAVVVRQDVLAAGVGLSEVDLDAALRPLVERQFLQPVEDGYTFRHALIRAAVYETLLPGERVRLHTRYAQAIATASTGERRAAELAVHWYAAGSLDEAMAAAWETAAAAGRAHGYDEQLRMLERVLALWDRVPDPRGCLGVDHPAVLDAAVRACVANGSAERGMQLATQALDELGPQAPPLHVADLLLQRSVLVGQVGADNVQDLEAALRLLPAHDAAAAEMRGRVLASLAWWSLYRDERCQGEQQAEEARRIAQHIHAPIILAPASAVLGAVRASTGDITAAQILFAEARDAAREAQDDYWLTSTYLSESHILEGAGLHEEAAVAGQDGMVLARRLGLGRTRGSILAGNLAESLIALGRWDEAETVLDTALATEPPPLYRAILHLCTGELALLRGETNKAERSLTIASPLPHKNLGGQQFRLPVYHLATGVAYARGDHAEAVRMVDEGLTGSDLTASPRYVWPFARLAARILGAGHDMPQHEALSRVAEGLTVSGALEAAHRAAFLAESAVDSSVWAEVAERWRELNRPYDRGVALLRTAEAALVMGDRAAAEGTLREAADIADRLGAVPLRDAVAALALRGGVGPRRRSTAGLTPRELDVLRLMSDGATNRQIAGQLFISPNTAGVHVSNILSKLSAASRTEAVTFAYRHGLLEPDQ